MEDKQQKVLVFLKRLYVIVDWFYVQKMTHFHQNWDMVHFWLIFKYKIIKWNKFLCTAKSTIFIPIFAFSFPKKNCKVFHSFFKIFALYTWLRFETGFFFSKRWLNFSFEQKTCPTWFYSPLEMTHQRTNQQLRSWFSNQEKSKIQPFWI